MMMEQHKSLLSFNTFGIDVTATCFAEYHSVDELLEFIKTNTCDRILHVGCGSNLLFLNNFDGLVLHSAIRNVELVKETSEDVVVRVGSGMVFDDLISYTLKRGWFGLENLSLIPGEVGASAVQNIGAYGVEAKDFITLIELVDLRTGEQLTMSNRDANYAYRYSIFKSKELWGKYAVTHVHFRLKKRLEMNLEYGGLKSAYEGVVSNASNLDFCEQPIEQAMRLRQIIIEMRNNKLPDPKVLGNAGSFFMNPIITRKQFDDLLVQYPSMPHYPVDEDHIKVPAGWLIEQSGWKGKKLGRAGVYAKQALVLVNLGGANGTDIVALSDAVRRDVKSKFGVDIHPEVNFI